MVSALGGVQNPGVTSASDGAQDPSELGFSRGDNAQCNFIATSLSSHIHRTNRWWFASSTSTNSWKDICSYGITVENAHKVKPFSPKINNEGISCAKISKAVI